MFLRFHWLCCLCCFKVCCTSIKWRFKKRTSTIRFVPTKIVKMFYNTILRQLDIGVSIYWPNSMKTPGFDIGSSTVSAIVVWLVSLRTTNETGIDQNHWRRWRCHVTCNGSLRCPLLPFAHFLNTPKAAEILDAGLQAGQYHITVAAVSNVVMKMCVTRFVKSCFSWECPLTVLHVKMHVFEFFHFLGLLARNNVFWELLINPLIPLITEIATYWIDAVARKEKKTKE